MRLIDYLRGWAAAALAYIAAERTTTIIAWAGAKTNGWPTSALSEGGLNPWLIPAVLSVIAAIVAVRRRVTAQWWKWLVLSVAVPAAAGALIVSAGQGAGFDVAQVMPWVITHVVVAGVLGITAGTVVSKVRQASQAVRGAR